MVEVTRLENVMLLSSIESVSSIKASNGVSPTDAEDCIKADKASFLAIVNGKLSWGDFGYYADLLSIEFVTNSVFIQRCKAIRPKKPKILSCPFCCSDSVSLKVSTKQYVFCGCCKAHGPSTQVGQTEEVIRLWNEAVRKYLP